MKNNNSFIENIFSVKNENIHKIVTILGIKLKFKFKKLVDRLKYQQLEMQIQEIKQQQLETQIQELKQLIATQEQKLKQLNSVQNSINYNLEKVLIPHNKEDVVNLKNSNEVIKLHFPKNFVSVGKYTYAHPSLYVDIPLKSKVGAFSSIAPNVIIGHGEHPLDFLSTSPYFHFDRLGFKKTEMISHDEYWTHNLKGVDIGNDVWIGQGAFIKNGIIIGDGAVIGAHAIVTKDVPPYAIVVGNPARILRYRFDEQTIKELLELKWWNLDDEIIKQIPYDNIESAIAFLKGKVKVYNG